MFVGGGAGGAGTDEGSARNAEGVVFEGQAWAQRACVAPLSFLRLAGLPVGLCNHPALGCFGTNDLVTMGEYVEFSIGEVFDIDHLVLGGLDGFDEFVKLEVDCPGVAVLGVLNEEDHEEGDDGRSRVDNKLPGIGVVIDGASDRPNDDDSDCRGECPTRTKIAAATVRKLAEVVLMWVLGPGGGFVIHGYSLGYQMQVKALTLLSPLQNPASPGMSVKWPLLSGISY